MKWQSRLLILACLILAACSPEELSATEAPPPAPLPSPSPEIESSSPIALEHIIAIRPGPNGAEFYNRESGEKFVPIGANLIQFHPPEGDTTFTVGDYDHEWMQEQLSEMESLGFNTLRVFVDLCRNRCIDAPGGGLRPEFIENLADFLHLAQARNIYVILTSNDLPEIGSYDDELPCCDPFGGYRGSYYLSSEGVSAWKKYFGDLSEALILSGAPTEIILAYQINNEQFFLSDVAPLSLDSGFVTTANGKSYDMFSAADKQAMVEEGLIYFANQVRTAVLEVDPSALVTIGFFPPDQPHSARNDNRLVITERFIRESELDFYDLHPYDWGSISLSQQMENFGILDGYDEKPLLMGEFGAFTYLYDSPESGAKAIVQWQAASCQYGFDGWLYWLWGERDFNNEVWTGQQGAGAINTALSPLNRPDPCDAGDYADPTNLAEGANLRASSSLAENPIEFATDGFLGSFWGSGSGPPQWIEIDLGEPAQISAIRLLVSQFPNGETRHRLRGRAEDGDWILLEEFNKNTRDSDWLEVLFDPAIENLQIIRIDTLESPSWVSWFEIVIHGEFR